MKDELDLQNKLVPKLMADILNSEDTMNDRVMAICYTMYLMGSIMRDQLDKYGYECSTYFDDTLRILADAWKHGNDGPSKRGIRLVKKDTQQ